MQTPLRLQTFLNYSSLFLLNYTKPQYIRTMTTFTLPNSTPSADVHIPDGINVTKDALLDFKPFKKWTESINTSLKKDGGEYTLNKLTITDVDKFGSKIGFVKFTAEVKGKDSKSLPGITLLRGPSVTMLVLLHPRNTPKDNLHAIVTIQPRIPAGRLPLTELPAGMLDDSGSFSGAAAKELEEEVGLTIPSSELIPLSEDALKLGGLGVDEYGDGGYYTSPGLLDETILTYAYIHELEEAELKDWKGKLTGLRDEGEKITLGIIRFEELWKKTRDMKALGAWALWKGLEGEGKLDRYLK